MRKTNFIEGPMIMDDNDDEMVQVFSDKEKQAVRDGTIDGDVYADGEVWVNPSSLTRWWLHRPKYVGQTNDESPEAAMLPGTTEPIDGSGG